MEDSVQAKDLPGFEGRYSVISTGKVYSHLTKKLLTHGDDTYGYDTVALTKNGKSKTYKLHRLVASTFLDNPENHPQVDHINRNRKDNNITNLRYLSASENNRNRAVYVKRPSELKNIVSKKSTFKVVLRNKTNNVYKSFKTLQEAQTFRDSLTKPLDSPDAL
jgi:hypothetical protein